MKRAASVWVVVSALLLITSALCVAGHVGEGGGGGSSSSGVRVVPVLVEDAAHYVNVRGHENSTRYSSQQLLEWYLAGQFDIVNERLLELLVYFEKHTFTAMPATLRGYLENFVQTFAFIMTRRPLRIAPAQLERYLELNDVISNIFAMSSLRTTDNALHVLLSEGHWACKVLVLYNPRNTIEFAPRDLHTLCPEGFSTWFAMWYSMAFSGLAEPRIQASLVRHQRYLQATPPDAEPRVFRNLEHVLMVYFAANYVDEVSEPAARQHVAAAVRAEIARMGDAYRIRNTPDPRVLCVVTGQYGHGKTIVVRVYDRFLVELGKHFDLTLIQINIYLQDQTAEPPPGSPFKRMLYVNMYGDMTLDLSQIADNNCGAVLFLDIGLNVQSLILSQLRLAPVQMTGHGHPVSTFGSQVDYFLGSDEAEVPENLAAQYSERVVLMPGLGVAHSDHWGSVPLDPNFSVQSLASFATPGMLDAVVPADAVIVNCPWHGQKINAMLLERLQQITARSPRHIVFRFFLGGGLSSRNRYMPMIEALRSALPNATVQALYGGIDPTPYLSLMREARFFMDAYPFGGVNTVMDALHLRRPFVCWEGERWINRVASAHMRRAGVPELVARSGDEYVALALRLIADEAFYASVVARLERADLGALFYHDGSEQFVPRIVALLMRSNDELKREQSRAPLRYMGVQAASPGGALGA